jgi:hypothetical protein
VFAHAAPGLSDCPGHSAAKNLISRTESSPQVAERQWLLNESLAEHRDELKRKAGKYLAAGKLKAERDGWRLRLSTEDREFLLQLLNDVRISSWRALGQPENLETKPRPAADKESSLYNLMQLAGYFESELLQFEGGD